MFICLYKVKCTGICTVFYMPVLKYGFVSEVS